VNHWHCVILAAGRGADDPMAKAFGVAHKCTIDIAGKPMLHWVLEALRQTTITKPYVIVVDDVSVIAATVDVDVIRAEDSAPASAIAAINHVRQFPVLITTGDHPLLTPAMIHHMLRNAEVSKADVLVGLATAETINASYPETKRTYFNLGGTRVSGCNLFVVKSEAGMKLLERWQHLERNRKQPWKLVAAFGVLPILWFALGMLTPERAFGHISRILGITVVPTFLPYAEAAIDVDKTSDHALAEAILRKRSTPA
jgi:GTP:adenosylcobinamide-phosphate guanylyltransferase